MVAEVVLLPVDVGAFNALVPYIFSTGKSLNIATFKKELINVLEGDEE